MHINEFGWDYSKRDWTIFEDSVGSKWESGLGQRRDKTPWAERERREVAMIGVGIRHVEWCKAGVYPEKYTTYSQELCVSWSRVPPESPPWRALNNTHRVMLVHKTLLLWWQLSSSVATVHTASPATVLLSSIWTWVLVTRTRENSKGRTVLESATGCRWRIKRWTAVSDVVVLAILMCRCVWKRWEWRPARWETSFRAHRFNMMMMMMMIG